MSLIVVSPLSLGNLYALLDKDDRYVLVTLENVKSRSVEVTVYIYDEHKDKKIQGNPDPVDASTVKHKFKFDKDDFTSYIGPGTQIITCIEFKWNVLQIASSQYHNHSG